MKTRSPRLFALLACLSMFFANHVQAQETDALQSLIDRVAAMPVTRAAGTVTDIDLSPYTQPLTTPLYVRNGINVRFINGTLTRANSFTDGPLIYIQTDSRLELAPTCTLTNGNVSTQYPVVNVQNGELAINGGKIISDDYAVTSGGSDVTYIQYSGEVLGTIRNDYSAKYYIKGGVVNSVISSNDIDIWGEAEITDNVTIYKGAIALHSSLKNTLRLGYHEIGKKVLYGYDFNVTKSDVEKMEIIDNVNNYTLSLENNAVYVREKQDEYNNLQDFIDSKAGATSVVDVDLSKFPDVVRDVPLYVRTGSSYRFINGSITSSTTFSGSNCLISISGGATVVLDATASIDASPATGTSCIYAIAIKGKSSFYQCGNIIAPNKTSGIAIYLDSADDYYYYVSGNTQGSISNPNGGNIIGLEGDPEAYSVLSTDKTTLTFYYDGKKYSREGIVYTKLNGMYDSEWYAKPFIKVVFDSSFADYGGLTDLAFWFCKCGSLQTVEGMEYLNTANVTRMDYMFAGCSSLTSLDMSSLNTSSVTNMSCMFDGCNHLQTIYVGNKWSTAQVTNSNSMFSYCTSLVGGDGTTFDPNYIDKTKAYAGIGGYLTMGGQEVGLKDGDTFIAETAEGVEMTFQIISISDMTCQVGIGSQPAISPSTTGIVTIPDIANDFTVIKIANRAFKECTGLTKVVMPNTITEIGTTNFEPAMGSFHGCIGITEMEIPGSVKTIGRGFISGCTNLTTLTIPESVIVIGSNAFDGCAGLTSVELSPNITDIQSETFRGCTSLESIVIPASVTSIGSNAFQNCNSLKVVTSLIEVPFSLTPSAFTNYQATLYVPVGTKEQYKSIDAWKRFYKILDIGSSDEPDDLQGWLDQLTQGDEKGTEENPVGVRIPDSGLDVDGDVTFGDDLQALLDGLAGKDEYQTEIPAIRMKPGTRIFVKPGSSLTIRNLIFEGMEDDEYIDVTGTLIIDVNVYIYKFRRFIYVHDGGRVIWRNGDLETLEEGITNNGGHIEYRGGRFRGSSYGIANRGGGIAYIYGGEISGVTRGIYNDRQSYVYFIGGRIVGGIENRGKLRIESGEIHGASDSPHVIENYEGGELTLIGGTIGEDGKGSIWSETDFWIDGNVYVQNMYIKRGARLHVIGKLNVYWRIHFFIIDEFDIFMPIVLGDNGYKLTEADCRYLEIDLPEGYRWMYHDGTVIIVRIPYDVVTIMEYLDFFGSQGTPEKPWSIVYDKTNIDIDIDWHIKKDYHLIFDDGQFSMTGGNIYIDEGASLWLKNIKFKGEGYHIYVYGTLYIDEGVDFDNIKRFIHLCKGGQIRFVKQPTYIVNIYISEEHIMIYKPIITDIREEWLQYINIELPDGYRWIFVDGTVVIIRIPYNVMTIKELLAYFGPKGTEDSPWSFVYNITNIDIEIDWYIQKDYHLLFDGGQFSMTDGNIYIDEGASLWLKNIRFTGERHIYVNGVLIIDENVDFGDIAKFIHLLKGGKIIVKKRLISKLYMVVGEVTHGEILAINGLTESDIARLDILLPDGYTWEYNAVDGTVIVKELPVTVIAENYTREYGEENPTFEFTSEGATLDGEPVIECEATATSAVGTYDIVIKKGSVKNYNDTYVNGTLTITKAPLMVTVKNVEREQGQENPQFEVVYEGWKLQDTESVLTKKPVATTTATKDSPVGEYTITLNGGEAQNYELTYQSGKLTVTVPSGIAELMKSGRPFDVYDAKGRKVCHQVTTMKGLKKGIYIINGKKVVVR